MLAALGGAAGLLISYWASNMLAASMNELFVMSTMSMDIVIHAAPDYRVLSATAAFCVVGTLLFGLGPAMKLSRPDVMAVLQRGGRAGGLHSGHALRNAVVVSEVALSLVLLVGSGLMLRSFLALRHVDLGYDSRGVLTFLVPNIRAEGRGAFGRPPAHHARRPGRVVGDTATAIVPERADLLEACCLPPQ